MGYVLMKCVMKYVEMVKQNEKVFTAHDFPKRQYFDNILIVFWVINATFLQLLNLEYVEHI